jgi:hypothetical protein
MSDLQIPAGRYAKRIFWTVVLGTVALDLALRFLAIPWAFGTKRPSVAAMLNASLGDILATVFAAVILSGIVLYLVAPTKKRAELDVVHPKDIGDVLTRTLREARSWHYSGSVGRWNRSNVLPALAEQARHTSTTRNCRLVIIDPSSERVCDAYADYRRGLNSGSEKTWTRRTVRADICATVVVAACFRSQEPLLQIELFFKQGSPVYRIDASDKRLVLTREDKREPGVKCDVETHFFDSFMETVNFDQRQSRPVALWDQAPETGALNAHAVQRILATAKIEIPESVEPGFLSEVLSLSSKAKDPYA